MELTYHQRQFLLEKFFKNEAYAGWRNIANKLLDTGFCIVPGEKCIWSGGIGNFIKTKETDLAVGCLEYRFDLHGFLSSEWFREVQCIQLDVLIVERMQAENKVLTVKNMSEEIDKLYSL